MDDARSAQSNWLSPTNYEPVYRELPRKEPVFHRIWRAAYGDDYPAEVEPHSFVTKTDLDRMVHFLAIGPGSILVDLGCGRGGPGLWLARATGADLIGIDLSPTAIEQAAQRIPEFGLDGRARFLHVDLRATGLLAQSCDAAVSVDVVMFIQDKPAVMREAARILRPGAPLVFTAFEEKGMELYRFPLQEAGLAAPPAYPALKDGGRGSGARRSDGREERSSLDGGSQR